MIKISALELKMATLKHSLLANSHQCATEEHPVTRIPFHRLLQAFASSVLLALTILTFPWLRNSLFSGSNTLLLSTTMAGQPIEDPFNLPELLPDLVREGVLSPKAHGIFLGDADGSFLPLLKQSSVEAMPLDTCQNSIRDNSVDFVIITESTGNSKSAFERVLRVGGVVVQILSSNPSIRFQLPENYMIVYVRKFQSTIVAIKKLSHVAKQELAVEVYNAPIRPGRKLLVVSKSKRVLLDGLENALLEPPTKNSKLIEKFRKSVRFLPDLIGVSLEDFSRRVLIDLQPLQKRTKSSVSFEKWYPTRNSDFDILRLDMDGKGKNGLAPKGIPKWLRRNVKEEDFVVMKAEAEVVEEMLKENVIGLVDELFMECKNQWQEGQMKSSRAYWECLTLYGRLRDKGIAVHQWWS